MALLCLDEITWDTFCCHILTLSAPVRIHQHKFDSPTHLCHGFENDEYCIQCLPRHSEVSIQTMTSLIDKLLSGFVGSYGQYFRDTHNMRLNACIDVKPLSAPSSIREGSVF